MKRYPLVAPFTYPALADADQAAEAYLNGIDLDDWIATRLADPALPGWQPSNQSQKIPG